MPVRILHVISEQTTEDSLTQLSLLLAGLPKDRFSQRIEAVGKPRASFSLPPCTHRMRPSGLGLPFAFGSPELRRLLKSHPADLALAWDTEVVPAAVDRGGPRWVTIVSTASTVPRAGRWYRSAANSFGRAHLICLSEAIRERLRADGLPQDSLSVIRPAADFAAVRQADRSRIRADLGLQAGARVLLTAGTPSQAAGQYVAVWATAILYQIWPDVRMILPGGSREDRRARRLAEECYCPEIFRVAGDQYTPADLLAASDLLILPGTEDQPDGWLAWAMAAGVPIVATAVPGIRELIRDGQTGFLVDSPRPHALATRIRLLWEDEEARRRCAKTASYVAYEMFRPQKCLDAYLDLFDRLSAQSAGSAQ